MPRVSQLPPVAATALAPSLTNLHLGTSGWGYPTWKPGFYPANVPSRGFLHYYASRFTSVEVNHTFRKLPERDTLQNWLDSVPPGFLFSFKAPELITHRKRLLNCDDAVAQFVDSILPARDAGKLGVLLFQLPPNYKASSERLEALLNAAAFGSGPERVRIAFEFRNESWFSEKTYAVLRSFGAALCIADSEAIVTPDVVTAPFRYYRFRKPGGYSPRVLGTRAQALVDATQVGEVFAYLKHEDEPTGALNALSLMQKTLKLNGATGNTAS